MRIKWNNILLIGLVVLFSTMLLKLRPALGQLLERSTIHNLDPTDRLIATLSLVLVCLTAVIIAKIISEQ